MRGSSSVVRRSVIRFAVMSVLVMAALGVVIVVVGSRLAVDEALHDAQLQTRRMADFLAAPLIDDSVRAGEPAAEGRLARLLENRMRDGSITHIVVYDQDGRVLWSDLEAIRRQQVGLEDDVHALLGTNDSIVDAPGEREPHPWSEPGDGDLIEVYAGAHDADGEPFVFEAYISPNAIDDDREQLLRALLPYVLGVVLVYFLATLPFAISLARRVDRAAEARSALLARSVKALQQDRQRVAQHLHDGVIQDLSAVGYTLTMIADPEPGTTPPDDHTRETAERRSSTSIRRRRPGARSRPWHSPGNSTTWSRCPTATCSRWVGPRAVAVSTPRKRC